MKVITSLLAALCSLALATDAFAHELWKGDYSHSITVEVPYDWDIRYDKIGNPVKAEYTPDEAYTVTIETKVAASDELIERSLTAVAGVGREFQSEFPNPVTLRVSYDKKGKAGGLAFGEGRAWIKQSYLKKPDKSFERLVAHEVAHDFTIARVNASGQRTTRMLVIDEWIADYIAFRVVGARFGYGCASSLSPNAAENRIRYTTDFDAPPPRCTQCERAYGVPRLFETEKTLGGVNLAPRLRLLYEQSATEESISWTDFVDGMLGDSPTTQERETVMTTWAVLLDWEHRRGDGANGD